MYLPGSSGAAAGEAEASLIAQVVREGARRMLAATLQAEVDAYIAQFADLRDDDGRLAPPATSRTPTATC